MRKKADARHVDAMMHTAVRLAVEPPRPLAELFDVLGQEEVVLHHALCLLQRRCRPFEVKVEEESTEEIDDGVGVLIPLLTDGSNERCSHLFPRLDASVGTDVDGTFEGGSARDYDRGDEVAEKPRAVGLQGREEAEDKGRLFAARADAAANGLLRHPGVDQLVPTLGVVEEDEERPVKPPRSLL